jgi:REP element-mobilizing transposase RayT
VGGKTRVLARELPQKHRRPGQTELLFRTWGGKREGSGRKPKSENRGLLPHVSRPIFDKNVPVHVSMRARPGVPNLRTERPTRLLRIELQRASAKGFRVLHFSIQTNHLHLIVEADDAVALSRGMQRLASRIAMLVNALASRRGSFWRERYHRRDLASPRQFRNALVYVLFNSRRHASEPERARRMHVLEAEHSSVVWVDAWDAPPELIERIVAARAAPSPVVRARTFIASRSWQRHGRLRPDEVPSQAAPAPSRPGGGGPRQQSERHRATLSAVGRVRQHD